jgi:hypothetical protein
MHNFVRAARVEALFFLPLNGEVKTVPRQAQGERMFASTGADR